MSQTPLYSNKNNDVSVYSETCCASKISGNNFMNFFIILKRMRIFTLFNELAQKILRHLISTHT